MIPQSEIETIASGTCGENLTWTLDGDGVLTISGTGEMKNYLDNYLYDNYAPWYDYCYSINKAKIMLGVTSIGDSAFRDCGNLAEVTIPNSATSIGENTCHCGDSYVDSYTAALVHDWDDGIVTIEPTEESDGEMTHTCECCAKTKTEVIPELKHEHRYEAVVKEPSCTERGYTTYACECGDSYAADFADELGYYHETADVLSDGEQLTLTELNVIRHNKHLIFSAHVEDLGQGIIRLSHGQSSYSGSYIEITNTQLIAYSVYKNVSSKTYDHGLTIDGDVKVRIDMERSNAKVTIETASGTFHQFIGTLGCNGEIVCSVEDTTLTDVDLRWYATGIASDYWFFGDSWFSTTSKSSWTTLMLDDGYLDVLLGGYGGMKAAKGLEQFQELLRFDTPKYAVWALGMNNGDRNGTINSSWLSSTEEFLALCEEYGIPPSSAPFPPHPR